MKGRGEAGREETTPKGEGGGEIQSTMNTMKVCLIVLAFFLSVSLRVGFMNTGRPYSDNF